MDKVPLKYSGYEHADFMDACRLDLWWFPVICRLPMEPTHFEQGTHGIVPVGTTGESATLTEREHCRVIELVVHVAGYYNRPSQEGLFGHFEAVNNASKIPISVYNIPPRATVDILPETQFTGRDC